MFPSIDISCLILLLCSISSIIALTIENPVLWERSFSINITNDDKGTLIQPSSKIRTSQDFQGIKLENASKQPTDRLIINLDYGCVSTNTSIGHIRQINQDSFELGVVQYIQKLALVRRGYCNWSEKVNTINRLSVDHRLNITAIFIYDNMTHQGMESIYDIDSVSAVGASSVTLPEYPTPLPSDRSILNMSDNDLDNSLATTVYFIPNAYGTSLVDKINSTYNPLDPTVRVYTLLTVFLDDVRWNYPPGDNFFSSGRGYLAYIIALGSVFLVGIIFLRWWRLRRMREGYNNQNGFDGNVAINMQQRAHQSDPLPVDIVNALPIDKYKEGLITNVNCAICLEDYVPDKTDIRILPCHHGFCVLCIDPWLTQKSTLCPICKWDCLPSQLREERNNAVSQSEVTENAYVIHMTPSPPISPLNSSVSTTTETTSQPLNITSSSNDVISPSLSSHSPYTSNEKSPNPNHTQPSSSTNATATNTTPTINNSTTNTTSANDSPSSDEMGLSSMKEKQH